MGQQADQQRDRFFAELAEDFARLRADPAESAGYDAELAAWDATLLDGLEDLPYEGETVPAEGTPPSSS